MAVIYDFVYFTVRKIRKLKIAWSPPLKDFIAHTYLLIEFSMSCLQSIQYIFLIGQ